MQSSCWGFLWSFFWQSQLQPKRTATGATWCFTFWFTLSLCLLSTRSVNATSASCSGRLTSYWQSFAELKTTDTTSKETLRWGLATWPNGLSLMCLTHPRSLHSTWSKNAMISKKRKLSKMQKETTWGSWMESIETLTNKRSILEFKLKKSRKTASWRLKKSKKS